LDEIAAKSTQSELNHTAEATPKALIAISFAALSNMNVHASGGPDSSSTAKLETL
jgi:hypothetical protein